MSTPPQLVSSLYQHALGVVEQLAHDIELGCPNRLALAHAMVSLKTWQMATHPEKFHPSGDRKHMRIVQALQIAINYYQSPAAVAVCGQDLATTYIDDFLSLIRDMSMN